MRVKSSCGAVPLGACSAKLMSVLVMNGFGPPAASASDHQHSQGSAQHILVSDTCQCARLIGHPAGCLRESARSLVSIMRYTCTETA